jgi:hypothetical protein
MGVPDLDAWRAWEPAEAYAVLAGVGLADTPWFVAGGWAVDLHLGRRTREHEDLEVAIPRPRFDAWRAGLASFDLYDAGSGRVMPLGPSDQPNPDNHQIWLYDGRFWRMDTFLEPGDDTTWVSHRDERVRVPMARVVGHTADGIPYQRPEYVLLGKAKHQRSKDEADLASLLPSLDIAARRWLAESLELVHPGHPWISRLLPA